MWSFLASARHAGTPLHHAAKRGLENTVKLLLTHGGKCLSSLLQLDECEFNVYLFCLYLIWLILFFFWQQIHLFSMMIVRHLLRLLESKDSAMSCVQLRYVCNTCLIICYNRLVKYMIALWFIIVFELWIL